VPCLLPNVDTQLTHPDDIVEELKSWVKTYAYIQNLSDIAQAHYHFEMIHPFSDGNGPSNDGPSYFTSKNKSSNLMSFSGNNEVIYHSKNSTSVL
jgi:hypothetical protein